MVVEPGSRVTIAFTATYPDGELFDASSSDRAAAYDSDADKRFQPIAVTVGAEPTIPSLQEGLLGMDIGETKRIEVPHEDLLLTYDRSEFEAMVGKSAAPGQEVRAETGLLGEVVAVGDEGVTVDFDPERAGQTLAFDVEVLEVE